MATNEYNTEIQSLRISVNFEVNKDPTYNKNVSD
jgi:hypothetical protein